MDAAHLASIVRAVQREYPHATQHVMRDDADRPSPRELHPAFYGCFDWHSAVEMHWALVVLVRDYPSAEWVPQVRAVLDRHLTAAALRAETDYLIADPSFERPYGWGWALQLAAELATWAQDGDADAARWSAAVAPLAEVVGAAFVAWLPKQVYPNRSGTHGNTAFALARSLPWARWRAAAGDAALLDAIGRAAGRWYGSDEGYSPKFEPGGSDFLSPMLTEMVLMHEVLDAQQYDDWAGAFQFEGPGITFEPARVTDPADGQGAHLHGLNLYRLHALFCLFDTYDRAEEPVRAQTMATVSDHVEAGLEALAARGWMAEHWLFAFGVLALRHFAFDLPGETSG